MGIQRNIRRKKCHSMHNIIATTMHNSFNQDVMFNFGYNGVKFKGICVKPDSVSSFHRNVVNLCIFNEFHTWSRYLVTDFTLGNCWFGDVKLTNNTDPDKYEYSGSGITSDAHSQFSRIENSWGKNVVIFGSDMISSYVMFNQQSSWGVRRYKRFYA